MAKLQGKKCYLVKITELCNPPSQATMLPVFAIPLVFNMHIVYAGYD
jgi:hypothetical protein